MRRRRSPSSRTRTARPSWLASFMWCSLSVEVAAEVGEQRGRRRAVGGGAVEVEVGSLQRPARRRAPANQRRVHRSGRRARRRVPPIVSNQSTSVGIERVDVGVDGDEPPAVAVHVVEPPAVDLALHELRRRRAARSEWMRPRGDAGQARAPAPTSPSYAGGHGLVAGGGLGRIGHADHLAELDRELDRRAGARQPLRLVGVEQRRRRRGRRARGRASTPGWRRRGGRSTCPGRRTAASGGRRRRRGRPGRRCHRSAYAGLERVDGVALEPGVAGVHVPRREQLPRPRLVVRARRATRRAGA